MRERARFLGIACDLPEDEPAHSAIAESLIACYFEISRGKKTPITIHDIKAYIDVYGLPIDLDIFTSTMYLLDNI